MINTDPQTVKKYLTYKARLGLYDPYKMINIYGFGYVDSTNLRFLVEKNYVHRTHRGIELNYETVEKEDKKFKYSQLANTIDKLLNHESNLDPEIVSNMRRADINERVTFIRTGKWYWEPKSTVHDILEFVQGYERSYPDKLITDVNKSYEDMKSHFRQSAGEKVEQIFS